MQQREMAIRPTPEDSDTLLRELGLDLAKLRLQVIILRRLLEQAIREGKITAADVSAEELP